MRAGGNESGSRPRVGRALAVRVVPVRAHARLRVLSRHRAAHQEQKPELAGGGGASAGNAVGCARRQRRRGRRRCGLHRGRHAEWHRTCERGQVMGGGEQVRERTDVRVRAVLWREAEEQERSAGASGVRGLAWWSVRTDGEARRVAWGGSARWSRRCASAASRRSSEAGGGAEEQQAVKPHLFLSLVRGVDAPRLVAVVRAVHAAA